MRSSRCGFAVLAVLALAPLETLAQPVSGGAGPATYLELHAGAVLPQHDDLDAFGAGFSVGGAFGARFTRHLSVEGEIAYWRTTASDGGVDQRITVAPFTASLRLRMPLSVAEVSVLGGAGLHAAWYRASGETAGVPVDVSENDAAFGFHLGAALAFPLSPTVLVGAEVRRTFVGVDLAGAETQLDGLRIALTATYEF